MRLSEKKRLALVLSGGGIKAAAFHLGVCLALREKGFRFAGGTARDVATQYESDRLTFKVYVGSSAGAVVSSFLASGYSIEAIIDAFERGSGSQLSRLTRRKRAYARLRPLQYRDMFSLNGGNLLKWIPNVLKRKGVVTGSFESLVKSGFKLNGLFTTKGLERYVREEVLAPTVGGNDFADLGVKLYIVATQLNHSRKVIFGPFAQEIKERNFQHSNYASVSDAVAASTSLPPVFAPYGIRDPKDGKEIFFFDGEIRDTLSTHVAVDAGADLVISSYSVQPYHYTPEFGSLHNYGIPVILNQALYQVIQQKIERHIDHQQQISALLGAVDGYFKSAQLPEEHREKLVDILSRRVNHQPGVDYIYVHPSPNDHEMFFVDHFSLNPEILEKIVSIGFRAGIQALRKIDR
jgi:predicted acylesterase/phospholipase RssA